MEINREQFEAWLAGQLPEKEFTFMDCTQCAMGQFLAQAKGGLWNVGGWTYGRAGKDESFMLPIWFTNATCDIPQNFTAAELLTRCKAQP